jgi:hypothetical protein
MCREGQHPQEGLVFAEVFYDLGRMENSPSFNAKPGRLKNGLE